MLRKRFIFFFSIFHSTFYNSQSWFLLIVIVIIFSWPLCCIYIWGGAWQHDFDIRWWNIDSLVLSMSAHSDMGWQYVYSWYGYEKQREKAIGCVLREYHMTVLWCEDVNLHIGMSDQDFLSAGSPIAVAVWLNFAQHFGDCISYATPLIYTFTIVRHFRCKHTGRDRPLFLFIFHTLAVFTSWRVHNIIVCIAFLSPCRPVKPCLLL